MTHRFLTIAGILFVFLATADAQPPASAELQSLLDEHWEFTLRESPQFASQTGDRRFNDRLAAVSVADSDRRAAATKEFLKRAKTIDGGTLPVGEQLSLDLFKRLLANELSEHRFATHLTPINNRIGFHVSFPELPKSTPFNSLPDYEDYLARLRAFGVYTDGQIALMREGVRRGHTMPAVIFEGWESSVDTHIVDDPAKSLLYEPFEEIAAAVPASEHERLREAARKAVAEVLVPAYKRFRRFMVDEYLPNCRTEIGASALPGGRDFYRYRVRKFTTLDTTPEEVHQRGLAEVKRIRGEMDAIIKRVGFDGDFAAFTEHLRTSPEFYAKTPDELLSRTAFILKKADGELPRVFGKLPRMPYGLRPVPDYIAPKTTTAYYQRPSGDGRTAGNYYINTYNLPSRPLYTLEALSLHEAVPGHHLQIALQQELENTPAFRKYSGFTAFVEGWALYAERLGFEMGFYEDPYSDFGRLTMEIWRAGRLVVDTGMHYFGWSRERAINFLKENSALSEHNIRAEVDRYIGWPGQALAYKTGELKIRELRAMAEKELGETFDIRAFHDVVLGSGAVPLDLLERIVREWVAEQKS